MLRASDRSNRRGPFRTVPGTVLSVAATAAILLVGATAAILLVTTTPAGASAAGASAAGAVPGNRMGGAARTSTLSRPAQDAATDLTRARAAAEAGRFQEARAEVLAALRIAPEDPTALELLGIIEEGLDNPRGALDAYRRALSVDPDRGSVQLRLGGLLLESGNLDDADPLLRAAAVALPQEPRAHAYLGLMLARRDQPRAAARAFERARALEPNDGYLAMDVAQAWWAAGDRDAALAAARSATELLPEEASTHSLLGELLLDDPADERIIEAPAAFRRAVALEPDRPIHREALAHAYHTLGLHDDAAAVLREAIDRAPEVARLHYNLGQMYFRIERYADAIAALERARTLEPTDGWSAYYLGSALARLDRDARALEELRAAVDLLPGEPLPVLETTRALQESGRLDEAERALAAAAGDGLWTPEMAVELGRLRLAQGRPEDAEPQLRAVVDQAPELIEARYLLGTALARMGRAEESRAILTEYQADRRERTRREAEELERQMDRRGELYALRGRIFEAEGRLEDAARSLEAAAELRPDDAAVWERLARVREALGDAAGAAAARARIRG